jgi:hypothetical protein
MGLMVDGTRSIDHHLDKQWHYADL